ncbi:hypothetical protein MMC30_000276 [Trapelia coarctata]|nr:hypothetical protein [Trapelia coarctata]
MSPAERIQIKIGDKPYDISPTTIPYFASYTDFQRNSGQAAEEHPEIPLFETAYRGVENGFRHCFRKLGTDFADYHTLCDTLDFLCIDTLGGRSINTIREDFRSGKGQYELEYKRSILVKGNKAAARDSAFRLLYLIFTAEFADEVKTRQKVYEEVLFVVSHRGIFKYRARKTIRTAYEERFHVSEK